MNDPAGNPENAAHNTTNYGANKAADCAAAPAADNAPDYAADAIATYGADTAPDHLADAAATYGARAASQAACAADESADHGADPAAAYAADKAAACAAGESADHGADPAADYAAALSAALHGPARAKAKLVGEIRDGLVDAIADHPGVPYAEVVREFGTVEELVPGCQRELTIGQTRATARVVAVTVPVLIVCWLAVWSGRDIPEAAQVLAAVGVLAVLAAGITLVTTGALARRLPMPSLLPMVAAWTGTTASVAMPLATVVLAIAAPAGGWALVVPAALLTVVSHGLVAASARACRHCARLPVVQPSAS